MFQSPQGGSETICSVCGNWAKSCFNPLKAGRKHRIPQMPPQTNSCFNPLKAGRKLLLEPCFVSNIQGFNPLKAGRKRVSNNIEELEQIGFNPLKAGRKPIAVMESHADFAVSIPSRRVGNLEVAREAVERARFQSPQGGSETTQGPNI